MAKADQAAKLLKQWGPIILTALATLEKLWQALNRDQRLSLQFRTMFERVRNAALTRDPAARISGQLDAIEEYLAGAGSGDDPELVKTWSDGAGHARRRVILLAALQGRAKRRAVRSLDKQVGVLFAAITSSELAVGRDPRSHVLKQGPQRK